MNRSGYNRTGNDPALYQQTYKFTYDAFGNTTGIRVGNTSTYNLGAYTYAPNDGLLTGMTWGNGATVSYTYDALGRKTQTATSSGDSYAYSYTGDGQLYQMTDVSGSLLYRYTYDTLDRLVGSVMKSGSSVCLQTLHHYDDANRLNRQIWSFGEGDKRYVEEYHYDANNGRLTKKLVKLPTDEYANITPNYDDLSRVSDVTTPAATTVYAYSPVLYGSGTTGLVSELTTTSVHTGTGVFEPLHLRYTYDALGNIRTEKRLNADDSTAESISYEYDNQSQLTQAHSSVTGTWSYQYDTYGNLRGTTHGSDTLSYTYGDANWIDLLTGVSGTKNGVSFSGSYVYDGAGNPTSFYNVGDRSTWTMSWKNGRELATATNGTHTVSYDYDGNGLRTWKLVDGIRHDYIYASGQLLRETFTQGGTGYTLDFLYDQNGRPYMLYLTTTVSGVPTSAPFYYVLNLQGDVIHLVRTNGVPAASYTYDPYGNVLSATGVYANVNPLRYRGYYYDTETGFYYLQSRYYDPALGRFINADSYASTGQGFLGYNMFAYCGNNPANRIDSNGDLWWLPGAIGAGINFISTLITGGDLGDACVSAVEGFALAYVPSNIVHVTTGVVEAIDTWIHGGSIIDCLGKGTISYLTSYVSGDTLLAGTSASKIDKYIIDIVFGSGATFAGEALSEGLFATKNDVNPFANNPYGGLQDHTPTHNYIGGGGGGGNTAHLVLY